MSIKNDIKENLKKQGIEKCGVTHYRNHTALVCLFPYYYDNSQGNLSMYARSIDYHRIIGSKLREAASFMASEFGAEIEGCFCDIGEEIDRRLAYMAGLGFYGDNTMLINEEYGSFFFIGYILCDLPLEEDSPISKECLHCGACKKSCPGNALENGFDIERCASHISQKKGDLNATEKIILKKAGSVFGCDICQTVCPYNHGVKTAMKEFCTDRMDSVAKEDIEALSGREFLKKYKNRAFSWRGKKVIERNLDILHQDF